MSALHCVGKIIELQENGGSGGIQAQIPNCTVYIGIAA